MKSNLILLASLIAVSLQFLSCIEVERTVQTKKKNGNLIHENEYVDLSLDQWLEIVCSRKNTTDSLRTEHVYDSLALPLIKQYYRIAGIDVSKQSDSVDYSNSQPYLEGVKIDLDRDNQPEIVCFIGRYYAHPSMLVFSKDNGRYRKIHEEIFWLHNEYPIWKVLENSSGNVKLLRTGGFHYRGSGAWLFAHKYYRKIGEEIKEVLEIPYRVAEHFDLDYLNSEADLIDARLIGDEGLQLVYKYRTLGTMKLCDELGYQREKWSNFVIIDEPNLLISLLWNKDRDKYEPEDLEGSIQALMQIDKDSFQWKAFGEWRLKNVDHNVVSFLNERIN